MEDVHTAVSTVLASATSSLARGISSHALTSSVALSSLRDAIKAADAMKDNVFVGSVDGKLLISVNKNVERQQNTESEPSKKRRRCPHEEAAENAIDRVKRGLRGEDVSDKQYAAASTSIVFILKHLRGAHGEPAVESWALTVNAVDPEHPKLVLTVRLSPGIAVSLRTLLQGVGKAKDGMLTTSSESLRDKFNLPLNEEARATERFGQKAMSLFATVEDA
tara:strand:+ start:1347 stop:2009 length:663 start_codon:yes stop_codon:yes gene_type:complete